MFFQSRAPLFSILQENQPVQSIRFFSGLMINKLYFPRNLSFLLYFPICLQRLEQSSPLPFNFLCFPGYLPFSHFIVHIHTLFTVAPFLLSQLNFCLPNLLLISKNNLLPLFISFTIFLFSNLLIYSYSSINFSVHYLFIYFVVLFILLELNA